MTRCHFNANNIMTAIKIAEQERMSYGMEYRIEAGAIITVFEPEYRVNSFLEKFNDANT